MPDPIGLPPSSGIPSGSEVQIRRYEPAPSLDAIRDGRGLLKDGVYGASVRRVQEILVDIGFDIVIDDKYGPRTMAAVHAFQRSQGLSVDELVGPKTLGALELIEAKREAATVDGHDGPSRQRSENLVSGRARKNLTGLKPFALQTGPTTAPVSSMPAGTPKIRTDVKPLRPLPQSGFAPEAGRAASGFASDRAGREQQAEDILRANGQWPPQEGRYYVVHIDQDSPPASASGADRASYLHTYTGQTVVLKATGGRLDEQIPSGPLRSASHPGQFTASPGAFTSVDGDRIPDLAHLKSGVYEYGGRLSRSGRFNPTSDRAMTVGRDINHNGVIDGARENDPAFYGSGIQLHGGNANSPSSVGCQTLPPDDFQYLKAALAPAHKTTFTYILVRRPNDTHGANPL